MNGNYLIAANSKRAQLIFNIFRVVDLVIALSGLIVTIILFLFINPSSLAMGIVVLLPLLVCAFLVVPVANYHNILCVIQNAYYFYFYPNSRKLKWKGWRYKDEYIDK